MYLFILRQRQYASLSAVSQLWEPTIVISITRRHLRLLDVYLVSNFDIEVSATQICVVLHNFRALCLALKLRWGQRICAIFLEWVFSSCVWEAVSFARHWNNGFFTEKDDWGSIIVSYLWSIRVHDGEGPILVCGLSRGLTHDVDPCQVLLEVWGNVTGVIVLRFIQRQYFRQSWVWIKLFKCVHNLILWGQKVVHLARVFYFKLLE